MLPIVGVPEMVRQGLGHYRPLFCREAGFEHVGRYITGLILSPNKTLQGIYDWQVWEDRAPPSRRAMHGAVFEAGWDADGLMPCHRAVVAPDHRGRGRDVLSLDWTYAHHDRGPTIWGGQSCVGSCRETASALSNGGDHSGRESCSDRWRRRRRSTAHTPR